MDLIYESFIQSEQIHVERRGARYSDPITTHTHQRNPNIYTFEVGTFNPFNYIRFSPYVGRLN